MFRIFVKFFCYFFFQAEDGIRDAQESRGLGDVYKRQIRDAQLFQDPRVPFPNLFFISENARAAGAVIIRARAAELVGPFPELNAYVGVPGHDFPYPARRPGERIYAPRDIVGKETDAQLSLIHI